MSKEKLVVVMGLPGVGKSELSKKLAEETKANRLNTDELRKKIFPQPTYASEETIKIYQTMMQMAEEYLSWGQDVILEGTFKNLRERELVKELAAKREAVFKIIEVVCSDEELLRTRIEARVGTGNPSDADYRIYELVKEQFAPITEERLLIDNIVDKNGLGELVKKIVDFVVSEGDCQ